MKGLINIMIDNGYYREYMINKREEWKWWDQWLDTYCHRRRSSAQSYEAIFQAKIDFFENVYVPLLSQYNIEFFQCLWLPVNIMGDLYAFSL